MAATRVPFTDSEMVWLIRAGYVVDAGFGPSGSWLNEDLANPSPVYLGLMAKRNAESTSYVDGMEV